MSLFDKMNQSYSNPGKGISKNARQKNVFFRFFEIFFSKFWQITKVNLYFNIVFIPVAVLIGTLFVIMFPKALDWYIKYFIVFAPIILLGPVMTGITKVTRDFAREVPGFPNEDFKSTTIKYMGKSLLISAVEYLLLWVIIIAVTMYRSNYDVSWFYKMGYLVSLFVAAVILFASYYIHIMLVTVDLSMKNIIKNSVLLSFLCLPRNLLLSVIYVFLTGVGVGLLTAGFLTGTEGIMIPLAVLYTLFVYFGTMSFSGTFITFPVLKKYIIDPYYNDNPNETAEAVTDPEKVFKNIGDEIEKKELPEYVYENGKLVHRSVIENAMAFHDDNFPQQNNDK